MIRGLFKRYFIELCCISIGLILFISANIWSYYKKTNVDIVMHREGYGKYDRKYEMRVQGLTDNPIDIDIPVSNIEYRDEDIDTLFDEAADFLNMKILGENEALDNIRENLYLPNIIEEYGFKVDWFSENSQLIDSLGVVNNENLKAAKAVSIRANISYKDRAKEYVFALKIHPKEYTADERKIKDFLSFLAYLDKENINEHTYILPKVWEGKPISYQDREASSYSYFIILAAIIAVLINTNRRIKAVEIKKNRNRELMLDYSELISKLMVFIGAGLSIRNSWAAIVKDYEDSGNIKRHIYQEMKKSLLQLNSGMHESKVYKEFGRRCGLKQYMKLSSLLEQNRKNGLNNFKGMLEIENSLAWQERINIAKRYGEEASTKLLLPLFIMLIIIMIMVIAPAIISFY